MVDCAIYRRLYKVWWSTDPPLRRAKPKGSICWLYKSADTAFWLCGAALCEQGKCTANTVNAFKRNMNQSPWDGQKTQWWLVPCWCGRCQHTRNDTLMAADDHSLDPTTLKTFFFQFEVIVNVLVSLIWIPMSWVYGHYKFVLFQRGDRL